MIARNPPVTISLSWWSGPVWRLCERRFTRPSGRPGSAAYYAPSHETTIRATRRPRPRPHPSRTPFPAVSVVVPTRNEARNLEIVLPAIAAVKPAVHEIIVVDGNSTDGTIEAARRVLPSVKIINQTRKGKGNAMACGFAAATGDVIVMFDADGSADPAEIPAFVAALVAGADFAKGTRFAPGGGSDDITLLRRSPATPASTAWPTRCSAPRYTDLCYGYNAFWADLLPLLELPPIDAPAPAEGMLWGDGFEIETVLNCRVAAAGLHDHRGTVDRAPAGVRGDATSARSPTALGCCVRCLPSTGGPTAASPTVAS